MLTMRCRRPGSAGALPFERGNAANQLKWASATTARGFLIRSEFLIRFIRPSRRGKARAWDSVFAMELCARMGAKFSAGIILKAREARLWCASRSRMKLRPRLRARKRQVDEHGISFAKCADSVD